MRISVGRADSLQVGVCMDRDNDGYPGTDLSNTGHSPIAWSMLGQRRRRWTNIGPAMGEWRVFRWGMDWAWSLSKLFAALNTEHSIGPMWDQRHTLWSHTGQIFADR